MTCPFRRLVRRPIQRLNPWENTNLGLSEDRRKQICDCAIGSNCSGDQQRGHGEKREDSMSMVAMVLYNPPNPAGDPVAARTFLACRVSRTHG